MLPSFGDLTFLDKIVLRDTRWWDALGKMYVMYMYARMFPHFCFQGCDLPHLSWVTTVSPDTFSEYLNGPRWDNVRNTGIEPRAVEWRIPVPPKCVLAPPTRTVPVRVEDDGSDLMLPLQNQ